MECSVETGERAVLVRPAGRIDETTWAAFSERLLAAVETARAAGLPVAVDFADTDYMSSRGLRALTLAQKAAAGEVAIQLARPNPRMREILAISRYDRIFPVTDALP